MYNEIDSEGCELIHATAQEIDSEGCELIYATAQEIDSKGVEVEGCVTSADDGKVAVGNQVASSMRKHLYRAINRARFCLHPGPTSVVEGIQDGSDGLRVNNRWRATGSARGGVCCSAQGSGGGM